MIVLDDVWIAQHLEPFAPLRGRPRSRQTRDLRVVFFAPPFWEWAKFGSLLTALFVAVFLFVFSQRCISQHVETLIFSFLAIVAGLFATW